MHELGVLRNVVRTVSRVAEENNIHSIQFVTLEVGEESSFLPVFLEKLYPAAIDSLPLFAGSRLQLVTVPGKSLVIKEIGY